MKMIQIIENSVGRANDRQTIAFRIPGQSKTGREMPRVVRLPGIRVRNSVLSLEINSRRSLRERLARYSLVKSLLIEESRLLSGVVPRPEVRFPAQAAIQCQMGCCFPGVLHIKPDVILPVVLIRNIALCEAR